MKNTPVKFVATPGQSNVFGCLDLHGMRVAHYSFLLAELLQLPDEKLKEIYLSGLLHDIGKTQLDQEILNKPSKLTTEEFTHIKQHIYFSRDIITAMGFDEHVQLNVLYHHENIDGSGYIGLTLKEIPIGARIVRIADAYDALTTYRSYKKTFSRKEAFELMDSERDNGYFDMEIYEIFKQFIKRDILSRDKLSLKILENNRNLLPLKVNL